LLHAIVAFECRQGREQPVLLHATASSSCCVATCSSCHAAAVWPQFHFTS
jgi:hypothetical protein